LASHDQVIKSLRKHLYPTAGGAEIGKAALLALAGALIAGIYGIIHDEVTYTISPEYFTRMKFDQFRAVDFGFSPRVFVAEIGFLATWWVGLIAAWFLARVALRKFEHPGKQVIKAMLAIVGVTLAFGITGYFTGPSISADRPGWGEALSEMGVTDSEAFYRVAGIHMGGYAGALTGFLYSLVRIILTKN
jgi:hypothetical protein